MILFFPPFGGGKKQIKTSQKTKKFEDSGNIESLGLECYTVWNKMCKIFTCLCIFEY